MRVPMQRVGRRGAMREASGCGCGHGHRWWGLREGLRLWECMRGWVDGLVCVCKGLRLGVDVWGVGVCVCMCVRVGGVCVRLRMCERVGVCLRITRWTSKVLLQMLRL